MKLTPIGIHVLIEPVEEQSLMVMPETAKGSAVKGIVLGVGEKVEAPLKGGDTVYFRKYSPEEFDFNDKQVYLVEEQDVMGKIEYGD
jgi:co-chaperonin GroES (HSP10)